MTASVLQAFNKDGQSVGFYTGKTSHSWVDLSETEAFIMGAGEAVRKAVLFNGYSVLTGLTFEAIQK